MMSVSVKERMVADEFLALPLNEGASLHELVDGEVVISQPTALHNVVQTRIIVELSSWVKAGDRRGQVFLPLDVKLDDLNVFAPDVSWYAAANPLDVHAQPPYPIPSLAAEVRSPSTWRYDVGAKKSTYERRGLAEMWLVDTAAAVVMAFRRSRPAADRFDVALELARGDVLRSPLLPGFALALDELFQMG